MEHVKDDKKLVKEIKRILKNDGILIIDSVIKKPFALYK
ncbi:class I SAM-dependent methyltransferase [Candidatus Woesearchaeota archaeon]|nr:class I SAM-dependent methyltransferase [Candidatus Woesearchaeota archaeon]